MSLSIYLINLIAVVLMMFSGWVFSVRRQNVTIVDSLFFPWVPNSRFTAVSNAASQREFIEEQCRGRAISNLEVLTEDMNQFEPAGRYDRIVSIEMFEHMRNWERLLSHYRLTHRA